MHWVHIGMHEVNDQRFGAVLEQPPHGVLDIGLVQSRDDVSVRIDAFADFEAQIARDQRLEASRETPCVRSRSPTELEGIAKSARRYQPAARALSLDHGVGADSGPMNDGLNGCCRIDQRAERLDAS